MLKASLVGSAAVVLGLVLGTPLYAQTAKPSAKMSQSECHSIWNRLDTSKSGNVTEAQAKSYVRDFKAVDTNKDGKLSQTEFNAGCDKGQVQSMALTGPSGGATSPKK